MRIVAGNRDKTAKVWDTAKAKQVSAWQDEERAAAEHLACLQRVGKAELERQRR
jgi:hypothetical protein